jgi:cytoskeletal protein CcmA (bactofilin family)
MLVYARRRFLIEEVLMRCAVPLHALRRRLVVASTALACLLAPAVALAQETRPDGSAREQRFGGDLFIGGGSLTVREPVKGDLFAGGGSIDIETPVSGDAVVAGGKLRLGADVGRNIYAAGGQVNVLGKVGGNARMAGGQVEIAPQAEVAGNVSVSGGRVELRGTIKGHVQAAGGEVLIDGPIAGDVIATSGRLTLGPGARIGGKLRYRSREPLAQDAAAQVSGGIEKLLPALGRGGDKARAEQAAREEREHERRFANPVRAWTVGLMLLAALLLALLPGASANVARTWRAHAGFSLLAGFVLLVCVPVAVLLLLISIIGIPVALAVIASYLALLPVAYVASAIGAGDWALQRWQPQRGAQVLWRIGAACLALLVLALLGWVPVLGWVIAFLALLAGLGAMLLQFTPWRVVAGA